MILLHVESVRKMTKRSLFIAGTDTNAGKTFITSALLRKFSKIAQSVAVIKPIQTGCFDGDGELVAPDMSFYETFSGGLKNVSFFCFEKFKAACAPSLAARLEGKTIDVDGLMDKIRRIIDGNDVVLVEGAGGLMVPIGAHNATMIVDLIASLRIPVVLVAPNRVGTINHVALSVSELQRRGIQVAGIILNQLSEIKDVERLFLDGNLTEIQSIYHEINCFSMPHLDTSADNFFEKLDAITQKICIPRQQTAIPNLESSVKFDHEHLLHPYDNLKNSLPVQVIESASGVELKTADGETLIDGISSWWCAIHGYNNARLNRAMEEQLQNVAHVMFAGLTHDPAIKLGEQLLCMVPPGLTKIFYSDSGSISVEVALKMAVQWARGQGFENKQKFFALRGGYHGDTAWAMSVCDPEEGMHKRFGRILPRQIFLPRPCVKFNQSINFAAEWARYEPFFEEHGREIAGFILEPIAQCAGGFWFYSPEYLTLFRELCNGYDILLIADEIATGFGRTGKLLACDWANIVPDIMCLGKGLTGGYMTLAATLTTDAVISGISKDGPLMHGPTFMANPLACAVARESMKIISEGTWYENTKRIEVFFKEAFLPLGKFHSVRDVRVLGSMGVVEMAQVVDQQAFQKHCVANNVWLRAFENFIYVMPAYVISNEHLETLAKAIYLWIENSEKQGL
ncbi:MAG: adenosylmethionine--8-amino-7-oxononanoate transaminase [Puniceicoccales bacterium]|jgi:adenosylmethionine-8-amino-7-oxononanoate aminotransferase|nr:adenosylmethionine--8-amino-7-oxononanoate transaminase [Puniceicoccales bacterium]